MSSLIQDDDWQSMTVKELRAECKQRKLSTAGTKTVLIARLTVYQNESSSDSSDSESSESNESSSASSASSSLSSLSELNELFGDASEWQEILGARIERAGNWREFLGRARHSSILPARELVFQVLKVPLPVCEWKVITIGQSPFPRPESATGVAHFDAAIDSWQSKRFGAVTSMRMIMKSAAMHSRNASLQMSVDELRDRFEQWRVVSPHQWFACTLNQGVMLLNAALTMTACQGRKLLGPLSLDAHTAFWQPLLLDIVEAILEARVRAGRAGVVFAWWGKAAEELRDNVVAPLLGGYATRLRIEHVVAPNPAAYGQKFCKVTPFKDINGALAKLGESAVEWLPTDDWLRAHPPPERMHSFIANTLDLHQRLFLSRIGDVEHGLQAIEPIDDLHRAPLLSIGECVRGLELIDDGDDDDDAELLREAIDFARSLTGDGVALTVDQIAAIYLYTADSALFRGVNAALRSLDRKTSLAPYRAYLRLVLSALEALPAAEPRVVWRGVQLDLSSEFRVGATITWWSISSSSAERTVAESFFSAEAPPSSSNIRMLFEVHARAAVSIRRYSAFSSEDEFLLLPGAQFFVDAVQRQSSSTILVRLRELDTPRLVK
jgi:uracil DNA glycosylase